MKSLKDIKKMVTAFNVKPRPEMRSQVLDQALEAQRNRKQQSLSDNDIWRFIITGKIPRLAATLVIIIVVLNGIYFWPGSSEKRDWWLGPPAAWGQNILAELQKVKAIVYSKKDAKVYDYGPTEMDAGWEKCYCAENAYRRDRYDWRDGRSLLNTQFVFPDGNETEMLEISHEYECYFKQKTKWQPFYQEEMKRLQWYVKLLDRADRMLDTEIFNGRECVGFEVRSSEYGDNPKGRFDRIWFDVETKLPARIERHGYESSFHKGYTLTFIQDEFEYYAEVPVDLFEPDIPAGFVNAQPDEVRVARDREVKGEMVYADVPEGLVDDIVTALRSVQNGFYHFSATNADIYVTKDAWRIDNYTNDHYNSTTWFFVEHASDEKLMDLEAASDYVLTAWRSDSEGYVNRVVGYTTESQARSRHPMDHILFLAQFCDRADRFIESEVVDGIDCFGFEISAKKYGDNPDTSIDRLWFDKDTKLPIRIEFEYMTDEGETKINVMDQFQWNSLPSETFKPKIREGYTFDPVPAGLQKQILDALDEVETCTYWQDGRQITLCRNAWREDSYSRESLQKVVWNVLDQNSIPESGSWDLNKKHANLTVTLVDFNSGTYEVKNRKDKLWNLPMGNIMNIVAFLEGADKFSPHVDIEGIECFGVEITPSKFSDSPTDQIWKLWFDTETKLPVRIEIELTFENKTIIQDRFRWDTALPEDTFKPTIPEGFELISESN